MKIRILTPILVLSSASVSLSQGTFQNLDFEQANLSGFSPMSVVPTIDAFPGWQAFFNTTPQSSVSYDALSAGAPVIAIVDDEIGYTPIQGNYTAFLEAAANGSGSGSATLSQTGLVPAGTESIQLDANQQSGSLFVVSVGGQPIDMIPLQTFANYTLYGGNISAWSGQDATLSVTELPLVNGQATLSLLQLDNISFSTTTVPEPNPFALTGVGGLLFALYRRFSPASKR